MKIAELASNPNVQIVVTLADLRELFLEWQDQYQNVNFRFYNQFYSFKFLILDSFLLTLQRT